jgi:hypothetical protein
LLAAAPTGETPRVITNVIIHLLNEMPIVVDVEALPTGADRTIACTNVRTIDGKRPSFVNDKSSTFILPLATIRLIEAPAEGAEINIGHSPAANAPAPLPPPLEDEDPDEDLLARIRQV